MQSTTAVARDHLSSSGFPEPQRFVFESRSLPERERLEAYCETVALPLLRADDMIVDPERRFHATFESAAIGPATYGRSSCSPSTAVRSRHKIDANADSVILYFVNSGCARATQGGIGFEARSGDGFIYCRNSEARTTLVEDTRLQFLSIPRTAVEGVLGGKRIAKPCALPAADPKTRLLRGYFESFMELADHADETVQRTFVAHATDLVALVCGAEREPREAIQGRGLKAARIEAVLAAIRKGHRNPAISAETVGRELGLSGRQVHRLLEETVKTFYEHVLECRLSDARAKLGDPALTQRRITDIAISSGFSDGAYFSRAFRTRFGDTPSDVREAAVRQRFAGADIR